MKKILFIFTVILICFSSCKSPEQKVIEQDYKTTTLVEYQAMSNMFGINADIDGDIKVLGPSDTIYLWQVYEYYQLEEHAIKANYIVDDISSCRGYIAIYYFSEYAQHKIRDMRSEICKYKTYYDSVMNVAIDHNNDIYAICYDCQETLTTKVNGAKEISVDTIQYYLDTEYNVIKDENIKSYNIADLEEHKVVLAEADSVIFRVNDILTKIVNDL